jgi:hypothetical protein
MPLFTTALRVGSLTAYGSVLWWSGELELERGSSSEGPLHRIKDLLTTSRHHLMYNESLELTAPQHTAVKI